MGSGILFMLVSLVLCRWFFYSCVFMMWVGVVMVVRFVCLVVVVCV